jgi:hypothetical protein
MRAHLFTLAACVALASAVGCARGENTAAPYPKAPAPPQMQPSMETSELNRASRAEDHLRTKPQPPQGPVSLTGLVPYGERFDPSGWSGSSTPKGIGGGPPAEATDIPAGNEPVGVEQGLVPNPPAKTVGPTPAPSGGLTPDEKPEPPKPPAKNDDLIDEYQ